MLPAQAYRRERYVSVYYPTQAEWLCTYINGQQSISTNEVQIRLLTTDKADVVVIEGGYLVDRISKEYVERTVETIKKFASKYIQARKCNIYLETKYRPLQGNGAGNFPDINDIMVMSELRE